MKKQTIKLFSVFLAGVFVGILLPVYTLPFLVNNSPQSSESIFIYGTLQNELIRFYACHCFVPDTSMTLDGFEKVGLNIVPSSSSSVEGNIIRVTPQQLKLIDDYENIPKTYTRSTVSIGDKEYFVYFKNE